MDIQLVITFAILIFAIVLFLSERLRPDLVALLVVVGFGITGILTVDEALSGFSRSAVITLLAIFILAEGLQRTGVTEQVGNWLLRTAGHEERRLVVVVMVAGAGLSLFMNNIAAASVLLPAVSGAARRADVKPSRLLMPLAFATILGGMATLLTTTNIVVSGILRDDGLPGYSLLDFAPLGIFIVGAGILYMAFWGRKLLPARTAAEMLRAAIGSGDSLVDVYRLGERLFRARIPAGSYLVGRSLAQSTFRETYSLNVVAVERDSKVILSPPPDAIFRHGDIVWLEGKLDEFRQRDVPPHLEILPAREWREQDLESPAIVLVETMLAPRSSLIGQTLKATHFREKYGMAVLAIWRGGRMYRTDLTDMPLQFGDALLLQGLRARLPVLRADPDLIILSHIEESGTIVPDKGRVALAIMVITLVIAAINSTLVGEIMLAGALLMVLSGALTMDQAYQAVEWRSVFLVAGMLPVGVAMTKTGAAALLAHALIGLLGPLGPLALLIGLFVLAALLTQTVHGAAVAAVMAPIAVQAAQATHADPRSLAMGVALATSMAFLTPLGHPVNVLVMGPGGYTFRDYLRVGALLSLILTVVILTLLPVFWPLVPR